MSLKVEFHHLAKQDLEIAVQYYENQQIGLGSRFLKIIEETISIISFFPDLHPHYEKKSYRKAAIQKFPFIILFSNLGDKIIVISIFHTKQSPVKLKRRFESFKH